MSGTPLGIGSVCDGRFTITRGERVAAFFDYYETALAALTVPVLELLRLQKVADDRAGGEGGAIALADLPASARRAGRREPIDEIDFRAAARYLRLYAEILHDDAVEFYADDKGLFKETRETVAHVRRLARKLNALARSLDQRGLKR